LILKQSVKANVFETALAVDQSEIPLPVGAESFSGASCTDNFAKEFVVWSFGFCEVGGDDTVRCLRFGDRDEQQDCDDEESRVVSERHSCGQGNTMVFHRLLRLHQFL